MLQNSRDQIVNGIERLVLHMLANYKKLGVINFEVPNKSICDKTLQNVKIVKYTSICSQHTFTLIVYVLAEVHRLLIRGECCTLRCIYYKDPQVIQRQSKIIAAKMNVCRMLQIPPWELGILSTGKGLVAGDLDIYMTNGDVISCNIYKGSIILPYDFNKIEKLDTTACFVLIVEKETIFQTLLDRHVFKLFKTSFILLTGKGYPDFTTRRVVQHLNCVKGLPVYVLVDADPFGIEIMLIYRHGSNVLSFTSEEVACPQVRWIGLHPSEINLIRADVIPLNNYDYKKLSKLLIRSRLSKEIRKELRLLLQLQHKAEIESLLDYLSCDYILNKIGRNLFL